MTSAHVTFNEGSMPCRGLISDPMRMGDRLVAESTVVEGIHDTLAAPLVIPPLGRASILKKPKQIAPKQTQPKQAQRSRRKSTVAPPLAPPELKDELSVSVTSGPAPKSVVFEPESASLPLPLGGEGKEGSADKAYTIPPLSPHRT